VPDLYNLYALELEPVKDEHAKWYVGITINADRRMAEHYRGGAPVKWVSRNKAVDHTVIGEWPESTAREYEDELTGLLMHEFGYRSVRGGRYTKLNVGATPPQDPTDPTPELVEALAETDHDELAEIGSTLVSNSGENSEQLSQENLPRIVHRQSVKDMREKIHELTVYSETNDAEVNARRDLEDRFDDDLYKLDAREAIYLAGMQNLDDAEDILREWGMDF